MARPSAGLRPAVLPSVALILGALTGLVGGAPPPGWMAPLWLPAVLFGATRSEPLARLVAAAAAYGAGVGSGGAARRRVTGTLDRWSSGTGDPWVGQIEGRVLELPERDGRGRHWVRVEVDRAGDERMTPASRLWLAIAPADPSNGAPDLRSGDRIKCWARVDPPSTVERSWHALARGHDAMGSVRSVRLIEIQPARRPGLGRGRDALKLRARSILDACLARRPHARAVVGAMLLGDRRALSGATRRSFRDAGVAHLLAISGVHVGILALALAPLVSRTRCPTSLRIPLVTAGLLCFALGVGGRASAWRAVLTAAAAMTGRWVGRDADGINLLAVAAGLMVWSNPALVFDPGFQLSFLATLGILRRCGRGGWLGASSAAYAATAPLVCWHFGTVSPMALVSNLVAIPLSATLLGAGYAHVVLGELTGVGAASAFATRVSIRMLLGWVELAASWDRGAWVVAQPALAIVAAYYLLWLLPLSAAGPRFDAAGVRLVRPLRRFGMGALLLATHLGPLPASLASAEVRVLDVGQGQAVWIRAAEGRSVLIDAGGAWPGAGFDPGERIVVPSLANAAVRRLDALALSHGDLDHAEGAFAVLRELEVGELWLGPWWWDSPRLAEVAAFARARGVALVLMERGDAREVGGLEFRAVGPSREDILIGANDRSLVLHVGDAPVRLLVAGDLESAGERALAATTADLGAEALVVAHHGSRHGTTPALLGRVAPRIALISCGRRNPFGHPHPEVLDRLRATGARSFGTDVHGALRLRATDNGWSLDLGVPSALTPRRSAAGRR